MITQLSYKLALDKIKSILKAHRNPGILQGFDQKNLEFNLWQLQLLVVADVFSGRTVVVLVVVDELQCYKCTSVRLENNKLLLNILPQGRTHKSCKHLSVSDAFETCPSSTGYVCSFFEGSVSFAHLNNIRTSLSITYIQSHTQSTTHGHTYTCNLQQMCMHVHANSHPIVHVVHIDVTLCPC